MDAPTLSIFIWGIYVILIGVLLLFMPGKTLILFGHEKPKDHWIRVVGIMALSLGYFYLNSAQNEVYSFYWASIYARIVGLIGFSGLVVFKIAKPKIILFGIIDAIGASWTLLTLMI
ncbi:MAG: hypothetical protein RLN90_14445 [Balneolaceae bacterium]